MVGWKIHNGGFDARTGKLVASNVYSGKATLMTRFGDLMYEAKVKVMSGSGNAGIVFRTSNMRGGPDGYYGYYAGIDAGGGGKLRLGRADGDWKGLKSVAMSIRQGRIYRIRVCAEVDNLQV